MDHDGATISEPAELGSLVRHARRSRHLSQADLAARLDVTRMTVSRMERGGDVAISTALAALGECGLEITPRRRRTWASLPEVAEGIREDLETGDEGFAIRRLRVALNAFAGLADGEVAEFLDRPDSTGDRRWDSLLAVAAARAARNRGLPAPAWTRRRRLSNPWFPLDPSPLMEDLIRQRTAPEFAAQNIFIDEREWTLA